MIEDWLVWFLGENIAGLFIAFLLAIGIIICAALGGLFAYKMSRNKYD